MNYGENLPLQQGEDGLSLHSVFAYMRLTLTGGSVLSSELTSAEVEYWISFRRIFVDTLKINT